MNKDAFSLSSYIKHVFLNYVEFLFRYFDFSSNRASIFSRIQQLRGETQLKLVRNGFTRWLTHDNVTRSIKLTFISLILALDELAERGDELADGLINYICTNEFVFVLLLMRDILPVMANVNAACQANNCNFVKVQKEL